MSRNERVERSSSFNRSSNRNYCFFFLFNLINCPTFKETLQKLFSPQNNLFKNTLLDKKTYVSMYIKNVMSLILTIARINFLKNVHTR